MMEETPRCDGDALLSRLRDVFQEDPAIDEIGLIFGLEIDDLTVDNAFVLAEHKLGVAFCAGPLIFRAARTRFHALRSAATAENAAELLLCTRAILLICADCYTAWNARKELVASGVLNVADEIAFCNLVLSLHAKSIDTWAYRRWLASRVIENESDEALDSWYQEQLQVCYVLAERQPRNYHAWSFRHWIVSRFNDEQLQRELDAMTRWCETHITDHSGWNHRQHTLRCQLQRLEDPHRHVHLLVKEFQFLSCIMAKYTAHEALWCHRRFVFQTLLRITLSGQEIDWEAVTLKLNQAVIGAPEVDLHQEWATVAAMLTGPNAVLGLAQDAVIAWRCESRFARRYVLWALQQLTAAMPGGSVESFNPTVDSMWGIAAIHDPVLRQLSETIDTRIS